MSESRVTFSSVHKKKITLEKGGKKERKEKAKKEPQSRLLHHQKKEASERPSSSVFVAGVEFPRSIRAGGRVSERVCIRV